MKNIYEIFRINAFTPSLDAHLGGNPAGVVLNADHLSKKEKLAIAKEIGFSETAFVSDSNIADFKLEFFTPTKQISDCGHATVAAFSVLATKFPDLRETSKEILGGKVRNVFIEKSGVFMEQPFPEIEAIRNDSVLSELFNESEAVFDPADFWIARSDNSFLMIELNSEEVLNSIDPNFEKIKEYSLQNDLVGLYLFVSGATDTESVSTRMFAPAYGIPEESATGVAAAHLTASLFLRSKDEIFTIKQGFHMKKPRPSVLNVSLLKEEEMARVGGLSSDF